MHFLHPLLFLLLPSLIASLRFVTYETMPFTTMTRECRFPRSRHMVNETVNGACEGSKAYEGLCIDLISALATELNSSYTIAISNGWAGAVGSDGSWSGLIGDVISSTVDVAVAPITVTPERAAAVDLTPFYASGVSLMVRKPFLREPEFDVLDCLDRLTLLNPFSTGTWIVILAAKLVALATSLVLYHYYRKAETSRRWRLLILLFLLVVWIGCTLVLICTTVHQICTISVLTEDDIMPKTVDELVRRVDEQRAQIQFGMQRGGHTHRFMDTSNNTLHKRIMDEIESNGNDSFVAGPAEGIERVRMSGQFAFLVDTAIAEYERTRRPCDVMTIGEPLIKYDFGIATKKGSELSGRMAAAMAALNRSGQLERLRKKWFEERGQCGGGTVSKDPMEVEWGAIREMYVIIGGAVIAIIASLILADVERIRRMDFGETCQKDEERPMNT